MSEAIHGRIHFAEEMTMNALKDACEGQNLRLLTMGKDWFVKGQTLVVFAFAGDFEEAILRYTCIESGNFNSIWKAQS